MNQRLYNRVRLRSRGRQRLAFFNNIHADQLDGGGSVVVGIVDDTCGNHERFTGLDRARGLAVDQQRCTGCGACQRVCPVDIAIHENPESMRCVRCLECVRACPEQAISVAGRS